jgi:hypothetical protein
MAVTQLADLVIPSEFTDYVILKSVVSTAFSQSGVMIHNGVMQPLLEAA